MAISSSDNNAVSESNTDNKSVDGDTTTNNSNNLSETASDGILRDDKNTHTVSSENRTDNSTSSKDDTLNSSCDNNDTSEKKISDELGGSDGDINKKSEDTCCIAGASVDKEKSVPVSSAGNHSAMPHSSCRVKDSSSSIGTKVKSQSFWLAQLERTIRDILAMCESTT